MEIMKFTKGDKVKIKKECGGNDDIYFVKYDEQLHFGVAVTGIHCPVTGKSYDFDEFMNGGIETKRLEKIAPNDKELEEASKPLIDLLYKYYNPHTTILVEHTSIRIVMEDMGIPLEVRD